MPASNHYSEHRAKKSGDNHRYSKDYIVVQHPPPYTERAEDNPSRVMTSA
jgi:hypothetical protein